MTDPTHGSSKRPGRFTDALFQSDKVHTDSAVSGDSNQMNEPGNCPIGQDKQSRKMGKPLFKHPIERD